MGDSAQSEVRILSAVGKGGFGTVYRAEMHGPGGFRKAVALKVLNDEWANKTEFAERLRDEARILGLLNHRAIVRVDGLRQFEGRWAVVMEFVDGVDLKQVMDLGPTPPGPAMEVIEEVASALDTAWSTIGDAGRPVQLLHRDIKPSNIHLTARGEVKVLDFGVARAEFQERESETRSVFFGSVGYMAPERMDGIDSHAGDVYSLAVVLIEMMTGSALGRSWSHPNRHEEHRVRALHRLWEVCPDAELYDLMGRSLAYEAAHRPNASDLARGLRSIRVRYSTPWLRDWAAEKVPIAAQRAAMDASAGGKSSTLGSIDHRIGNTAADGSSLGRPSASGSLASTPSHGRKRTPTWLVAGIAALGAMFVVVPIGGGVVWMALATSSPVPPPPAVEEVAPVEASPSADRLLDVDEEPPPPDPPPEPVKTTSEPARRPVRQPDRTPAPTEPERASASTPAPGSPPAETGRVVVTGDATTVRLIGAGTSLPPGVVPAGTYAIRAAFGDGVLVDAGSVTVSAGGVVTLSCRGGLKRCVPR